MSEFFLKIINMSISASWLVLAVLLLRLALKKAPKWVSVLLWGFVAVRLVLPFSFESILSLIPSTETVSPDIMMDWTPEISTGIGSMDVLVNPIITEAFAPDPVSSANPLQILIPVAAVVWLAGIAGMLLYTAISYFVLRHKVATAVRLQGNIFQSERVTSPFVLGIVRPRIYLPFQLDGKNLTYVVAHEQAHLRRKDHWWKPLGFVLLSLHWFNPLMWLGYILLCRDIELACDEKVIKEMDHTHRADYTQALVTCSVSRRSIAACPLAFGEVGVKARVKSVMNYKKPAFWLLLAAILLCTAVAVCFLTDPLPHTLQNIEFYDLDTNAPERTTVLVSDGTTHQYAGAVARSLLQDLYDLKISRQEVSLDRSEDRDMQNTLILGIPSQEESEILKSFVGSIQFHFNADFTEVWADDAVKPTLSYRVLEPAKAQLIYLRIYNTLDSGIIAKSGNNQVNLIAVPAGTAMQSLADAVQWLTIAPGEEEFVPFRVLKNNQERNGRYGIYDAQTFQPLDYFLPSGLSPQTYLFQNADPNREYLVTVSLSDESGARDYAFGVRFDQTVAPQSGDPQSQVCIVDSITTDLITYYELRDGTWRANGQNYRYRLTVTGRPRETVAQDSTFVFLSNLETITFDQAWDASGLASSFTDYFRPEEAILVERTIFLDPPVDF